MRLSRPRSKQKKRLAELSEFIQKRDESRARLTAVSRKPVESKDAAVWKARFRDFFTSSVKTQAWGSVKDSAVRQANVLEGRSDNALVNRFVELWPMAEY